MAALKSQGTLGLFVDPKHPEVASRADNPFCCQRLASSSREPLSPLNLHGSEGSECPKHGCDSSSFSKPQAQVTQSE